MEPVFGSVGVNQIFEDCTSTSIQTQHFTCHATCRETSIQAHVE